MERIVHIDNLVKVYGGGATSTAVRALDGVNLDVMTGQFIAVMGASGSGKSTLLYLTGGLDRPTSGQIIIGQQEITRLADHELTLFRRRRLGFIFQSYNLLPMLNARQNVELPLLLDGVPQAEIRKRTDRLLGLCELTPRANHLPDELSGGEQQRVAIARALLNEPMLLLADEPTGNLDSKTAGTILGLLRHLAGEMGKTVLMVTHEPRAASLADVLVLLKDGKIVHQEALDGPPDAARVVDRYKQFSG